MIGVEESRVGYVILQKARGGFRPNPVLRARIVLVFLFSEKRILCETARIMIFATHILWNSSVDYGRGRVSRASRTFISLICTAAAVASERTRRPPHVMYGTRNEKKRTATRVNMNWRSDWCARDLAEETFDPCDICTFVRRVSRPSKV